MKPEPLKGKELNKKGAYERAFERYILLIGEGVTGPIKLKKIGKLYMKKDIKSAVEWLKELLEYEKSQAMGKIMRNKEMEIMSKDNLNRIYQRIEMSINQAFEDVIE